MCLLFSPLQLKSVYMKNRFVQSPMCMYSAQKGRAGSWHFSHYGTRALGGVGAIVLEATAVSPEGRITFGDLGIWADEHIKGLSKITAFLKKQNVTPAIQLAHAGRKASCDLPWHGGRQLSLDHGGWETLAPSSIPFYKTDRLPRLIQKSDILKILDDFESAALRALEADFEILEIHAAHGYLLNQFLSPLTNLRSDEYGGSFENRISLLLQVLERIQKVWPKDQPIFVRISVVDYKSNSWTIEDSLRLSDLLLKKGVDLIDCSSGGLFSDVHPPLMPLYQVPFAERIKKEVGIPTAAVGLINKAQQAEEILLKGQADLIFLGRKLLSHPYFPLQVARKFNVKAQWPLQYLRAF